MGHVIHTRGKLCFKGFDVEVWRDHMEGTGVDTKMKLKWIVKEGYVEWIRIV
jgi:hypothetical protein